MIDGNVRICDNLSSELCNVCLASPKHMNKNEVVQKRPINSAINIYGSLTLHVWIRLFGCLLHLTYRLDFKNSKQEMIRKLSYLNKKCENQKTNWTPGLTSRESSARWKRFVDISQILNCHQQITTYVNKEVRLGFRFIII